MNGCRLTLRITVLMSLLPSLTAGDAGPGADGVVRLKDLLDRMAPLVARGADPCNSQYEVTAWNRDGIKRYIFTHRRGPGLEEMVFYEVDTRQLYAGDPNTAEETIRRLTARDNAVFVIKRRVDSDHYVAADRRTGLTGAYSNGGPGAFHGDSRKWIYDLLAQCAEKGIDVALAQRDEDREITINGIVPIANNLRGVIRAVLDGKDLSVKSLTFTGTRPGMSVQKGECFTVTVRRIPSGAQVEPNDLDLDVGKAGFRIRP